MIVRASSKPASKSEVSPATLPQPTAEAAASAKASSFDAVEPAKAQSVGVDGSGVGPMDQNSPAARRALVKSLQYLDGHMGGALAGGAGANFEVQTMERDELGMVHIRFNRVHDGVLVFPEQVIAHLGPDGMVRNVTGGVQALPLGFSTEAALSESMALGLARSAFNAEVDATPTVQKVITQGDDGAYRIAYHVECSNLAHPDGPKKQNYLIDGTTGAVMKEWNDLGGFNDRLKSAQGRQAVAAQAADPLKAAEAGATPNAAIPDMGKVESKIALGGDFPIGTMQLDLDIDHTYRGDLYVTVTSPSGKTYVVSNRQGGSEKNIKESFDLSDAFAGEPIAGDWTLTVEDKEHGDTGKLNAWKLTGAEADPNPPPPPPQLTDDTSIYAGTVALGASVKPDGTYKLLDKTRGRGVETRDAMNRGSGSGAKEMSDANNIWGEATDDARNKAGVDAQYGGQMTYDFLKNILGRSSIDGAGEKLLANVHINTDYVNAFWDGSAMNYGDGNGTDASSLTTLDVAGHEITHGLTQRTANLIYSGESGGLNEAWSDILGGAGVEWYAMQNNPMLHANPYAIGDQCWTPSTPGDALRYMDDPTKDEYSVDNYINYPKQTEVHGSSGIANNAFYLLTHGGTNRTSGIEVKDAIGMEKGLKIFGRALIHYMTRSTTFAQARVACIQAAGDLYGADSVEVSKVKEAWTAVGVNDPR